MAEFRTNEMSLAAYLCAEGHWYQSIEQPNKNNPRFTVWVFLEVGNLLELVDEFHTGNARVEPLEFTQTLADVRKSLFSHLDDRKHAANG